jgi:hypothetical protein
MGCRGALILVAWGGIEKSSALGAAAHFPKSSYLLGYMLGYTKTGYSDLNAWHRTTDT